MTSLPISLNCENVSALIVGGGAVGTRKALTLHSAGASVRVISPDVNTELAAAASSSDRLTIELKGYSGATDIRHEQLVIAATSSADLNERIVADAHALGRLASNVNSPADGSFVSMAVHRAGALAIGVSTGSVPPAAVRIRDAIAERFDDRFARAVDACSGLRSKVLRESGTGRWSELHSSIIGEDFCAEVESGAIYERLAACR